MTTVATRCQARCNRFVRLQALAACIVIGALMHAIDARAELPKPTTATVYGAQVSVMMEQRANYRSNSAARAASKYSCSVCLQRSAT